VRMNMEIDTEGFRGTQEILSRAPWLPLLFAIPCFVGGYIIIKKKHTGFLTWRGIGKPLEGKSAVSYGWFLIGVGVVWILGAIYAFSL